jgi:hypothetical protein
MEILLERKDPVLLTRYAHGRLAARLLPIIEPCGRASTRDSDPSADFFDLINPKPIVW